jgi:hypothetical protein
MVIITFASGAVLFNFVMSNVNFAKNSFTSQMSALLVQSFTINATQITAWLQNTGNTLVEITGAYVNGLIAILTNSVNIQPGSVGATSLQGDFTKGGTYTVKLLSVFNTLITFDITY